MFYQPNKKLTIAILLNENILKIFQLINNETLTYSSIIICNKTLMQPSRILKKLVLEHSINIIYFDK